MRETKPGQVRSKERTSDDNSKSIDGNAYGVDTLTMSVSFIAVADVRPTSERHGRCRQREALS